jgi:hypothetical protein
MEEKLLPTRYSLEIYEDSFANTPSIFFESINPIGTFNVGDFFNHRNFDGWLKRPNTENEKFVITQVEHIVWKIEDSHIGHKTMICLKIEPYIW